MEIKASSHNKPNDLVRQLQWKLNAIGTARGQHWEQLASDGIYGRRTASVVKQFVNWNRQASLATDGQGLPLCTDSLIKEVNTAYGRLPMMSAARQPILTSAAGPVMRNATPADQAQYKRMLQAETATAINGNTALLPGWLTTLVDDTATLAKSLIDELKLMRSFKSDNPWSIIDWYSKRANPKIEAIKRSYLQWQKTSAGSDSTYFSPSQIANERQAAAAHHATVEKAYPIGKRFDDWLKKYNIEKKVDAFMKSKAGKVIKGAAKPVKYIWLFKDIIMNLCVLGYRLIKGQPIDQTWWASFEKNLTDLADALIFGMLAELVVLGLVAIGALAGPATLVAGIIGIVVAVIFGLICNAFDFSPAKFFSQVIAKGIVTVCNKFEPTITRGMELYGVAMQGSHQKI